MRDYTEVIYGHEPKCPHCGEDVSDAWELGLQDEQSVEHECGECSKPFRIRCSVSITYISSVIEPWPSATPKGVEYEPVGAPELGTCDWDEDGKIPHEKDSHAEVFCDRWKPLGAPPAGTPRDQFEIWWKANTHHTFRLTKDDGRRIWQAAVESVNR